MDELNQAYAWLKWEVDRQRNSVVPTKGKSGPELVAAVFNAVLAQSSPRRDVLIVENTFREYLASAGADGPAVMGACLNRGWIEPVADNGKRRRLRVDETRLTDDAEEFASGENGTDDPPHNDSANRKSIGKIPPDPDMPEPGYLELIVDRDEQTVRREGDETVVKLPPLVFRLFCTLYDAGETGPKNDAVKNAYKGEPDSVRSQIDNLRKWLDPLGVTVAVRNWRLVETSTERQQKLTTS